MHKVRVRGVLTVYHVSNDRMTWDLYRNIVFYGSTVDLKVRGNKAQCSLEAGEI